jgi:ornithine carbamoyltransferase
MPRPEPRRSNSGRAPSAAGESSSKNQRAKTPVAHAQGLQRETSGESKNRSVRHIRSMFDLTAEETNKLVDMALKFKKERDAGTEKPRLPGKVLGLVFEKPSMRTRVSFEAAMVHLGGGSVFLSGQEVGFGERESESDIAKVMSGYVDALAVRTFSQDRVDELARNSSVPVINALSDTEHPCQALGDFSTMKRHAGKLKGLKLAFVGDANNVARSLATAAAHTGVEFTLASPKAYAFPKDFLERLAAVGGSIRHQTCPGDAVKDADFVYTDVWTSMGQESETTKRRRDFAVFQVDAALMKMAKPSAKFLHCLPAKRGEEVTAEVIDGPASLVFEQAEFRLHAQKALLVFLLSKKK